MIGSIIGDIVGSIYEFNNIKTKDFEFFQEGMTFTDDSILTVATADWLTHASDPSFSYFYYSIKYPKPMGSYGGSFLEWRELAKKGVMKPYNSCGNGAAMRVGPVGWMFNDMESVLRAAKVSAACTHNHPEGIIGAQAVAACILLARQGAPKDIIKEHIEEMFGYDLSWSVKELQERYSWSGIDGKGDGGTCQDSVPQAIICALEATDFEDAIRNAISIGGDSDTIGCITGSIAEALYGVPGEMRVKAMRYLDHFLAQKVDDFEELVSSNH